MRPVNEVLGSICFWAILTSAKECYAIRLAVVFVQELEEDAADEDESATGTADGKVLKGGDIFGPGDCIYVEPDTFDQIQDSAEEEPEVHAQAWLMLHTTS